MKMEDFQKKMIGSYKLKNIIPVEVRIEEYGVKAHDNSK